MLLHNILPFTLYSFEGGECFLSIFASVNQKSEFMEEKKNYVPVYKRVKDVCLDIYTRDEHVDKRLLKGRALLNTEKGEFAFVQNEPRGARSVEIGRSAHSRLVRRPDGLYTLTFSCMDAEEVYLREQLISEVRVVCAMMKADREKLANMNEEGGEI